MKKGLRIAAIVVATALALAGGAAGLSRIVYGRSLRATLYEWELRRRFATDRTAEEEAERLEAKRARGESPYALPDDLRFDVSVDEADFNGMQVFTLNGGGSGPLALYLHGGAYINQFNAYQWKWMNRLARETGCSMVAPAYHLAPIAD